MLLFVFISLLSGLYLINGEQTTVTAKEGENVTLPCNVDTKRLLLHLQVVWKHGDPGKKIVFTYMNNKSYDGTQNPQFQGRVSFFEEEIKRGNASIQLTNVTQTDAGIYTCLVSYHDLLDPKKESSVHLVVLKVGKTGNYTGPYTTTKPPENKTNVIIGVVVLLLLLVLLVAIIVFVIYRKCHKPKEPPRVARSEEQMEMMENLDQNAAAAGAADN